MRTSEKVFCNEFVFPQYKTAFCDALEFIMVEQRFEQQNDDHTKIDNKTKVYK